MNRQRNNNHIMLNLSRCLRWLLIISLPPFLLYHLLVTNSIGYGEPSYPNLSNVVGSMVDRRKFSNEQLEKMSVLGRWMFFEPYTKIPERRGDAIQREYLILIWPYGPLLEKRHLRRYINQRFSPWENCSVDNCRITVQQSRLEEADIVVFSLHHLKSVHELPIDPKYEKRPRQRWVFQTIESPSNTFKDGKRNLFAYNGIFNWSMTYRSDSDVPVPYGRTIPRQEKSDWISKEVESLVKMKTKLVAIMGSNCTPRNDRWSYASKLKLELGSDLDVYGNCSGGDTSSCPGHFHNDCELLSAYKFYLAFENSNCREYFTEKVFWHGYAKYAVPIIMGPSLGDCYKFLPPKSFIHVNDFANPMSLANYLRYLDKNYAEYLKYHEWRISYDVVNEHGFFESTPKYYCRLCEAINYNDPTPKVYDDLEHFWNRKRDCD